jgi:translocation and assembly module TamA
VRYYTDFGPLRFDLATPLTQKDDVDQNYQIYISIGQAF